MAQDQFKRKLTTILSADVAGYSHLMGEDEASTVKTLKQYKGIMSELIHQYRGYVVDSPGDNLLAEFASVVDAVQCAVATQKELQARNAELHESRRMQFRIGVNLGDVIEEGERIYGDGVNIAARLESLAEPGGICISKTAFDQIETKLPFGYTFLGEQTVKNITRPVGAYKVILEPRVTTEAELGKITSPAKSTKTRKIAFTCAAVILVAIGVATMRQLVPDKTPPIEDKIDLRKVAFPVPGKASIAVLPFQNMTGDPQQGYFSDGMAEQLITGLSQTPDIYVSARTSSFAFKGKSLTAQQIAEQLGVRYLLEGSVQRDADRVRVNVQLIDGSTGNHIWAERYDRQFEDLFALQDQITMDVMEKLNIKFIAGISATNLSISLKHYRPGNLKAYESYLKGVNHFFRRTRQDSIAARLLFEEAVSLDPNFAVAYRSLGFAYADEVWFRFAKLPEQSIEKADQAAKKFVALAPDQPPPFGLLSMISLLRKDFDNAVLQGAKAVELSANDPGSYYSLALALRMAGRYEEAIKTQETSFRLAALRPLTWINNLAWAYLGNKQYDKAILLWNESLERNPDYDFAFQGLTVAYELSGNHEKARWSAENVIRLDPNLSIDIHGKMFPSKDDDFKKRVLDAWRSAGLK